MSSMTYKDKKRKTDHHVIGMGDSMPQKKRRSVKWKTLGNNEVQQHVVKNIALRKHTWTGGRNVG